MKKHLNPEQTAMSIFYYWFIKNNFILSFLKKLLRNIFIWFKLFESRILFFKKGSIWESIQKSRQRKLHHI